MAGRISKGYHGLFQERPRIEEDIVLTKVGPLIDALPAEVIAAIQNAKFEDVYSVVDVIPDAGVSAIKANRINFAENSRLRIPLNAGPVFVFLCKELSFSSAKFGTTLYRDPDARAADGAGGDDGADGTKGNNHGSCCTRDELRDPKHATSGRPGEHGDDGQTLPIPDVYIITASLLLQESPANEVIQMVGVLDGIAGGDGGNGGDGGDGGNGGRGASGMMGNPCFCHAESGGNGGNAGAGGHGGDAGAGGDGGSVFLVGPEDVISPHLSFIALSHEGAKPGIPGGPGRAGKAGRGGPRGSRPGFTRGGRRGRDGKPATGGTEGAESFPGLKGSLQRIPATTEEVMSLFD